MSVFASPTEQIGSPHAWTFSDLRVDGDGNCVTTELRGLRDIKAKGLVVRYPNPFAGGGDPEVLHETSEALHTLWQAGDVWHAFGKKHYTNASGKWKASKTALKNQISHAWGSGDAIYCGCAHPGDLYRVGESGLTAVDFGVKERGIAGLGGTAPDDVYVSTNQGLVHHDGTSWRILKDAPIDGSVACASRDEVYLTGRIAADDVPHAPIYRGNARAGFAPACEGPPIHHGLALALGSVFVVDARALKRLSNDKLEHVMQATGYVKAIGGTADLLWVANGIELLCFDGNAWKQVPRVWHEKK